jgi:hypothetical protein
MDWSKLQGKPKEYVIGKSLPEDERITIKLYPLSDEDADRAQLKGKTAAEKLQSLKELLAYMMRLPEDEAKQFVETKFSLEFIDDFTDAFEDRLNVTDKRRQQGLELMKARAMKNEE